MTEDWNPLEPDVIEEKSYAPGIGLIHEEKVAGGDGEIELIEFTPAELAQSGQVQAVSGILMSRSTRGGGHATTHEGPDRRSGRGRRHPRRRWVGRGGWRRRRRHRRRRSPARRSTRRRAAALEHTGEGRVTETEVGDEESYYEVEVTLDDGSQVDVQLDEEFNVVGDEADDDGSEDDD